MERNEYINCPKCYSHNSYLEGYCKYCHHKFARVPISIEEDIEEEQNNNKLIVVGAGLLTLIAFYYIFK